MAVRVASVTQWVTVVATVTDPGGSGSLSVEWRLESTMLSPPAPWHTLATGTMVNNGTTAAQFRPADHLVGGCGGQEVKVWLRAIDQDSQLGASYLPLVVNWPPC